MKNSECEWCGDLFPMDELELQRLTEWEWEKGLVCQDCADEIMKQNGWDG